MEGGRVEIKWTRMRGKRKGRVSNENERREMEGGSGRRKEKLG